MITPARVGLALFRNSDYTEEFAFSATNQAIDFTGYTGRCDVRRYDNDPGNVLFSGVVDLTAGDGILALSFTKESISLAPEPTKRGEAVKLAYDVVLTTPSGDEEVWILGSVKVLGGISQ